MILGLARMEFDVAGVVDVLIIWCICDGLAWPKSMFKPFAHCIQRSVIISIDVIAPALVEIRNTSLPWKYDRRVSIRLGRKTWRVNLEYHCFESCHLFECAEEWRP